MSDIKVFNRWDVDGIAVDDAGLADYVNLEPRIVPRTGSRFAGNRFHKSKTFIVERFMNKIMVVGHRSKKHFKSSGHCTGKAATAYRILEKTFTIIEQRTKQNPIKVLVQAIVNAAPREEIITIEYGGARYPKSVECAPQRRIDIALRYFAQGSYQKSFNSKKPIEQCLADEILNAYQRIPQSLAISKKLEVERQADASR